jgi:hypothetical protein
MEKKISERKAVFGLTVVSLLVLAGTFMLPVVAAQTSEVTIAVCWLGWLSNSTCLALGVTETLIGMAISYYGMIGVLSAATGGLAGIAIGGVAL